MSGFILAYSLANGDHLEIDGDTVRQWSTATGLVNFIGSSVDYDREFPAAVDELVARGIVSRRT